MSSRSARSALLLALLATLCAFDAIGSPSSVEAVTLQSGSASFDEQLLGVRYRSFRNTRRSEIQLGAPDPRVAAQRSERDITWVAGPNEISLTFDPSADLLSTTVTNAAGAFSLVLPNLAATLAARGSGRFETDDLNVLTIRLVASDPSSSIALRGLAIDGRALGDLERSTTSDPVWTISGHDFGAGFSLHATLVLDGHFRGRAGQSRVEIDAGVAADPTCVEDAAVAAMRAVLDAESPFRLASVAGTLYDVRNAPIRWSFLADDALYLDGVHNREYRLCSTEEGVILAIPFTAGGETHLAHFLLQLTDQGFDMIGRQKVPAEGLPRYLDAGRTYRFTTRTRGR